MSSCKDWAGWPARIRSTSKRKPAPASFRCGTGIEPAREIDRPLLEPHLADSVIAETLCGWLIDAVQRGASDLHIVTGHPPTLRLHGDLQPIDSPPLSEADVTALLTPLLPATVRERFAADKNADFAFQLDIPGGP